MSKIEEVRTAMYAAMKAKDKERKDALSMLLGALKAKAIDKREDLTEAEENSIIAKEIKQCKDTIEMSPADRTDIIDQCKLRIDVYEEFAPKQMSEDEIKATIQSVLDELGITEPTGKDRGKIMKDLMPKVKGKADGKLVNQMVACGNPYLAFASNSSHFLSTSAWILAINSSFPGLNKCLNLLCGRKKSSIGSFFLRNIVYDPFAVNDLK